MNDYQEWCKSLRVVATNEKNKPNVLSTKVKKGEGENEESQNVEVLKEQVKNNLETIQLLQEENVRLEREIQIQTTLSSAPKTSIEKVVTFLDALRKKWEDDVSLKYPDFFYDGKPTSNFIIVDFYNKKNMFRYDMKTSFRSQKLEFALFKRKYQQQIEKNPELGAFVATLPPPPSLEATEELLNLLDETGTIVTFRSFAKVFDGEEYQMRGDVPVAYWGPDYKGIQNRFKLRKQ